MILIKIYKSRCVLTFVRKKWAMKFMRLGTTVKWSTTKQLNFSSERNNRPAIIQVHFLNNPKDHHRVQKHQLVVPNFGRINPVSTIKFYYCICILLLVSISDLQFHWSYSTTNLHVACAHRWTPSCCFNRYLSPSGYLI